MLAAAVGEMCENRNGDAVWSVQWVRCRMPVHSAAAEHAAADPLDMASLWRGAISPLRG